MNKDVFFLIANFDPKSLSSWSVGSQIVIYILYIIINISAFI